MKSIAAAVRATDCGELIALSASSSVPLLGPTAEGVNVTFTVQVPFGAIVPLQVSVSEKSAGFVPPKEMPAI